MNSKEPKAWLRGILDDEDPHGQVGLRLTAGERDRLAAIKARKSPGEQMKELTETLVVKALTDGPKPLDALIQATGRSSASILQAIRSSSKIESESMNDGTRRLLFRLAGSADMVAKISPPNVTLTGTVKSTARFLFVNKKQTIVVVDDEGGAVCLRTGKRYRLEEVDTLHKVEPDKLMISRAAT